VNPLLDKIALPPEIESTLERGAPLLISISGGKDSDAMCELLPDLHKARGWTGPIALIHADLKDSEWSITTQYIKARAETLQLPLYITTRSQGSLLQQMQQRHEKRPDAPPFPSAAARYCTADHKRTPLDILIRQYRPMGLAVCAIGIRAEESPARARKPVYQIREKASNRIRWVYDWLPLFNFTLADVWDTLGIGLAELRSIQQRVKTLRAGGYSPEQIMRELEDTFPYHPAYALGNDRLSCSLCILASRGDLHNGAELHQDYYRSLVQLEIDSGFTFRQNLRLGDLRPDLLTPEQREAIRQQPPMPRNKQPKPEEEAQPTQLCFDIEEQTN
jgi:3'-phosphoadenosine 5'-phosphosulfate sulfotransferase (PAPS reductase)/FAD synthetase